MDTVFEEFEHFRQTDSYDFTRFIGSFSQSPSRSSLSSGKTMQLHTVSFSEYPELLLVGCKTYP